MAKLESEAKPILTPLISGDQPAVITVQQQVVILRWLMKTAFLFDVLRPNEFPPFFTPEDRSLMASSIDLAFHPMVFLAGYQGQTNALGAFFVQLIYGAHRTAEGNPSADHLEFHLTLNLGRLALQVVCLHPNPSGSPVRGKPVSQEWRDCTIDITTSTERLPRPTRDVEWPLPKQLDDTLFALFRDRHMVQYLAEGHLDKLRAVKDEDNRKH
jgi:hypothetical protein